MKVAEKRTKDIIYLMWPSDVKDVVDLHLKKGYCHRGKPGWIGGMRLVNGLPGNCLSGTNKLQSERKYFKPWL